MDHTISILVETLHNGVEPYTLATAIKIPLSAMEAAAIYDIDDYKSLPWIYSLLPAHARGECILRITRIFEVVIAPSVENAQPGHVQAQDDGEGDDRRTTLKITVPMPKENPSEH
jgi:hypothetical protein